jgi:hypothetical protein
MDDIPIRSKEAAEANETPVESADDHESACHLTDRAVVIVHGEKRERDSCGIVYAPCP